MTLDFLGAVLNISRKNDTAGVRKHLITTIPKKVYIIPGFRLVVVVAAGSGK